METHAAQDVKMVLMHAGQYPLADGGECAFVVGQKDCLRKGDYITSTLFVVFDGDGNRPPGDSVTNKDGLSPFGCIGKKVV